MADYFDVTLDYLLGKNQKEKVLDMSLLTPAQRKVMRGVFEAMLDKNTKQKEDSD